MKESIDQLQKSFQKLLNNFEFTSSKYLDALCQNKRFPGLLKDSLSCVNDLNKLFEIYKTQEENDKKNEKARNSSKSPTEDLNSDSLIYLDDYQNIPDDVENDLSFDLDLEEELQSEVS